jgi:hypothetical protein
MIAPSPCTAPGSPEHPSERNYQRSCCKGAEPCWRPCLRCAARTWRAGVRCPDTVSPTSATPRSCWSWPIGRAQQRNKWRVQGGEWRDEPRDRCRDSGRTRSIQPLKFLRPTPEADLGRVEVALGIDADVHPFELPGRARSRCSSHRSIRPCRSAAQRR